MQWNFLLFLDLSVAVKNTKLTESDQKSNALQTKHVPAWHKNVPKNAIKEKDKNINSTRHEPILQLIVIISRSKIVSLLKKKLKIKLKPGIFRFRIQAMRWENYRPLLILYMYFDEHYKELTTKIRSMM